MAVRTHVVLKSGNSKIGSIAATYRTQASCPTSCPLMGNGCYASGRIFGIPQRLGREDLQAVLGLIDTLPQGRGLRLNVSGDFLTDDGTPDHDYIAACNAVAEARPDVKMIAYTHAWRSLSADMFSFSVNASCESDDEIAEALATGWQAVTVNGPVGESVSGRKVVRCPAETRDNVSCETCMACAADTRTRPVISFTAHGGGKAKATRAVDARRSLPIVEVRS